MCYHSPRPSRHRSPHFNPTEKVRTLKNTYFSISATLEQLLSRMKEYAQMTLPSEFEDMRADAKEPLQIWPGDGLAWSGTFYAVSIVDEDVPFFEMGVQEVDGTCRVRIRCLDPKAAVWVREMIVWLAPGRASGYVQPLPDLPGGSTFRSRSNRRSRLRWPKRECPMYHAGRLICADGGQPGKRSSRW